MVNCHCGVFNHENSSSSMAIINRAHLEDEHDIPFFSKNNEIPSKYVIYGEHSDKIFVKIVFSDMDN